MFKLHMRVYVETIHRSTHAQSSFPTRLTYSFHLSHFGSMELKHTDAYLISCTGMQRMCVCMDSTLPTVKLLNYT